MTKIMLGRGRTFHFMAGWVLVINGVVTLSISLLSSRLRRLMFRPRTRRGPSAIVRRLIYAGLLLVVIPALLVSGLTLSPSIVADYPTLSILFGGRQSARTIHFLLAAVILLFTIGHVWVALRSTARLHGRMAGRSVMGEASVGEAS